MTLRVREATVADAPALAALAGELGYPVDVAASAGRLAVALADGDRSVFVAEVDGRVAGWIDVAERRPIQEGRSAEIGGLVVTADRHRSGLGRALVAAAEQWAAGRGLASLTVRSRSTRDAAHAFYRALGFEDVKTSLVFRKPVESR
jgi:ribosomal protein S18 acetylase RimI-like enzyme